MFFGLDTCSQMNLTYFDTCIFDYSGIIQNSCTNNPINTPSVEPTNYPT